MNDRITDVINEQIDNLNKLKNKDYIDKIISVSNSIIKAMKNGNKIIIAGNGGSASDAQHFAAELVGRFVLERKALPAIAINTDTSILTCMGNDYGYDYIFSRQVEALGNSGDIFIGISTSGNSNNIIKAVEKAKEMNIKTIALTGKSGGLLKELCDESIIFDYVDTARIQEHHIMTIHLICEFVEKCMKDYYEAK